MASLKSADWLSYMRLYALDAPELFTARYPTAWLEAMCGVAAQMVQAEVPSVSARMDDGQLSEQTVAYVVCEMVLRVVRYRQLKSETNGTYTYTTADPEDKGASANLYVSARERELLQGFASGVGPVGSISMGLDRAFGM